MQEKQPFWKRILHSALVLALTLVLLCAFFLAVIMGHPQDAADPDIEQPLLPALSAPLLISGQDQLMTLLDAFPAPVLAAMSSAAMTFTQGTCGNVPFEDGYARVVTLTYQTADGAEVTVESIYPARALDVMGKGDYVISGTAGQPLAGLRSIRMEKDSSVRMHAQGEEALYVVTLPQLPAASLRTLTSTLQLYQGN